VNKRSRKLALSRETLRGLDAASGSSRVRCGAGTYADSCLELTCGGTCEIQCNGSEGVNVSNCHSTCRECTYRG